MYQRHTEILAYLIEKGEEGATASEIAKRFGLDIYTVATRLRWLQMRGWVEKHGKRGSYIYKLTPEAYAVIKPRIQHVEPKLRKHFWVWLGLALLMIFLLSGEDPEKGS